MFSDLDVDTRARIMRTIDGVAIWLVSGWCLGRRLERTAARHDAAGLLCWEGGGFDSPYPPIRRSTVRGTHRAEGLEPWRVGSGGSSAAPRRIAFGGAVRGCTPALVV